MKITLKREVIMSFKEFETMVFDKTGAGVYRHGEQLDGRCNASCIKCGSDIYLSLKASKKNSRLFYRYCDCE